MYFKMTSTLSELCFSSSFILLVSVFTNSAGICKMDADSRRIYTVATAVATQAILLLPSAFDKVLFLKIKPSWLKFYLEPKNNLLS